MSRKTKDYIIAVMARDRPGIISSITRSVFELGGNVIELSQTVMRGYFSLILCATLPAGMTPENVRKRVEEGNPRLGLTVSVREYDPQPLFLPACDSGIWFLTLQGRDRPGLICQVASHLAERDINIEDLYTRTTGEEITMILQLHPADQRSAGQLRASLEDLSNRLAMETHLLHQDILRATSEVGAIRRLVRRMKGEK